MAEDDKVTDLSAYKQLRQRLRGDGDGGHDGGMSDLVRRVGSLETKVDQIRIDLAEIKGKLSQMPTATQLILGNFGLALAVAALVFTIARAMK